MPEKTPEKPDDVLATLPGLSIKRPTTGPLDACLVYIYPTGPEMGRRYPLGFSTFVAGRNDDCDIRLQDNSVSRRHARIDPAPDGYRVSDLGSTNGTFVNDVEARGPRPLNDGDYLRVGNCIFRYLTGGNVEADYHEEIYRLTIIDGLTQVNNRRYLTEFLDRELARSNRHQRPLSLMLLDLDSFKAVNDTHGHVTGDVVLRELSERVRPGVRREDLFARYGGEEFAIVLVETQLAGAVEMAERIRQSVASAPFLAATLALNVTVSIGVACTQGERAIAPSELLQNADEKLYAAKRSGRNRVVS
ncbi:GGDEF domain-containing protein [Fimbriiglobus ruber]|uniref:diguanylate cyclase n=1 Tax=Fimbriiglobus ruber TaxID=1908690 RepID=A0A225DZA8_9BACT|nr:GGDEF domain-containing protein [Fimbriiglobus ruber]OWK46840.1 diguanylate cyclase/phosphodiesterase (GGDEF & EAL domains) with PAS/PAC sensor(s) [Fimbriiglobus ruber]